MIGFELTEEQRELQRVAAGFAEGEVQPLLQHIARSGVEKAAAQSQMMYAAGVELGLTRMLIPEAAGGGGLSCLDATLLLEELGAVDVAIAADYFALNTCMPLVILRGATKAQQREWMSKLTKGSPLILAGAQSEANVSGGELFSPDPDHGMRTRAYADGDSWVINGSKSAFVTNAGVADYYLIMARTDFTKSQLQGVSMFLVNADAPGFSIGKRTELAGWHSTHHAELNLAGVVVDGSRLLGGEGAALPAFSQVPEMGICLAACFVGLARRCYEYALSFAQQRVSWGKPIIEHQSVALKLADMAVDLETARLLVWRSAAAVDSDPQAAATVLGPAAKTHAVDVAIRNSRKAVEILGGYGVAKEYPVSGWYNDAIVGYACDFTREMLRLGMVPFLVESS